MRESVCVRQTTGQTSRDERDTKATTGATKQTGTQGTREGVCRQARRRERGKLTLERGVEGHGAQADDQIAQQDEDGDARVAVGDHIPQAPEAEPHEDQVGERVDQFGAVEGNVVVL